MTFLFRQMGTFNTAKMQDLRNLTATARPLRARGGAVPAAAARG